MVVRVGRAALRGRPRRRAVRARGAGRSEGGGWGGIWEGERQLWSALIQKRISVLQLLVERVVYVRTFGKSSGGLITLRSGRARFIFNLCQPSMACAFR